MFYKNMVDLLAWGIDGIIITVCAYITYIHIGIGKFQWIKGLVDKVVGN